MQLAQADRAKPQGLRVALPLVIGAVFNTVEKDAMLEAEHVRGFVHEDLATAPEQHLAVVMAPLPAEKNRVVAGETVDANPLM